MSDDRDDLATAFDDDVAVALAELAAADSVDDAGAAPHPSVRQRLMARLQEPAVPTGFAFRYERAPDWMPHPVPGIRMKVLALDRARNCATLLLDVAPGTRFPPHHHGGGAEECYVISGSLFTCGRLLRAGDFVHADADTDHGELFSEEGCRVLLVVPPEDYMSV